MDDVSCPQKKCLPTAFNYIILIIVAVLAGFGGGWVYQLTLGKNSTASSSSTAATNTGISSTAAASTSSAAEILAACLTEVWGSEKYAVISANASLATTEDKLASLKCYNN